MKIGVDARNLVPRLSGIGRYTLEMCRHLAASGHELFLYLPEQPYAAIPQLPQATMRVSSPGGAGWRMMWAQTALPTQAAKDGVDAFWGPAHRLPRFLDRRIARVVTIHDLVWLHAAWTMRRRSLLADRLLMAPAVGCADRIAADSAATAKAVGEAFPLAKLKTRVIYPGLTQLPAADPRVLAAHGIDRVYGLFVGTLEPRKNLTALLEAFSLLSASVRDVSLLVIAGGQGWGLDDLSHTIARLGLTRHVRLTGYVSDESLAGLYAGARFLAMPSLYEGFGIPIIEANAAGIPALVSNTASMPEVAGAAGLLVDPADVGSIALGMRQLFADDTIHSALAASARANAARFCWRESAAALTGLLRESIEMRKTA